MKHMLCIGAIVSCVLNLGTDSLVKEVRGRGANGHMLETLELLERGPRAGYSWAFEPYPFKP